MTYLFPTPEASYIIFRLPPCHANIRKRLVKSPKLYFYDVGLAACLLGIENELHVSRDPLRGNFFENMVVIEALKYRLHRGKRSHFRQPDLESFVNCCALYVTL